MKYLFAIIFSALTLSTLAFADDASASFNPARILDDSVMTDSNSLSPSDIQNFLDSKVTCDTWGTKRSEFGGGTRAQYAASRGWQAPPYYCITTYKENGVSAAQIIYDKAQKYRISPKVLIVLLQKEQGLITDEWPTYSPQYKTATGYGCPDTAPCDSQYFGLANQLDWAAKMFRSIMDANPRWYTPYVLGNNYIQYSPIASCGGSTVNIQNRATQALYNYTPYQPNQAALNAGWGTAPCGAYGNRNFYLYYTSWFGATKSADYSWEEVGRTFYTSDTKKTVVDPSTVKQGQYLFVQYKVKNTGGITWNGDVRLGAAKDANSAACTGEWLSCNRPAGIKEAAVQPGGIATIEFWMRAPATPGTYKEYYNLVAEGKSWFVDIGSHWQINVSGSPIDDKLDANKNTLKLGESIMSQDRQSTLTLSPYGTLEIYNNGISVWKAPGSGGIDKLVVQEDGNMVAYSKTGEVKWVVNGSAGSVLQIVNNKLLYKQGSSTIWETAWNLQPANPYMVSNQLLHRGQRIWSADGSHSLVLQDDGNLVQYGQRGAVWASNTQSGFYLAQQDDGNLVLYNEAGNAVWASHRSGSNVTTYVQNDGNIVSYGPRGPIWAIR